MCAGNLQIKCQDVQLSYVKDFLLVSQTERHRAPCPIIDPLATKGICYYMVLSPPPPLKG